MIGTEQFHEGKLFSYGKLRWKKVWFADCLQHSVYNDYFHFYSM